MTPYFTDGRVTIYLGDCRKVIPALGLTADVALCDPPYGETSLAWDRWPDGWPAAIAGATRQMWCFGSMRMFLDRRDEFDGWKLAQDVVWEKHNGSGFAADRFKRVHEYVTHWYRGKWGDLYRDPQREPSPNAGSRWGGLGENKSNSAPPHTGKILPGVYLYDGTRLVRSVVRARSMQRRALHPTEKPDEILGLLVAYSCPPGGLVLDPFTGSGSALATARRLDRDAVGIEADERYAEIAARRLSQADLFEGATAP